MLRLAAALCDRETKRARHIGRVACRDTHGRDAGVRALSGIERASECGKSACVSSSFSFRSYRWSRKRRAQKHAATFSVMISRVSFWRGERDPRPRGGDPSRKAPAGRARRRSSLPAVMERMSFSRRRQLAKKQEDASHTTCPALAVVWGGGVQRHPRGAATDSALALAILRPRPLSAPDVLGG